MASTLVETVSLNYEDFHDSFLTCSTCLCMFDAQDHSPKLLPCSHTVCRSCLEGIVHAAQRQQQDTGVIRCPICRETIQLPRGGVTTFPPSFIVNQLLDLMRQQRRDVVPKCTLHPQEELFFCESCDTVFCTICTGGQHNGGGASEHTVIPFSIAIKRMSEILLYKSQMCTRNLNKAYEHVLSEIEKVDQIAESTAEQVNRSLEELVDLIEKRKRDVLNLVQQISEAKKKVLQEQLEIIQTEKEKVEEECGEFEYQVEVRNITEKIEKLNEKLDMTCTLAEPRENSFMRFQMDHNNALEDLSVALNQYGRIKVSTTFPALCTAEVEEAVTHLKSSVTIATVDYHGNPRTSGFDPLVAVLRDSYGVEVPSTVDDDENGTYTVSYTPVVPGKHWLTINIFNRPIRGSPFTVDVSEHNNPILRVGSHGTGDLNFRQPTNVAVDSDGNSMFILDTGNSRIKEMSLDGEFSEHIGPHGVENQGCLGMDITPNNTLVAVNWRTKHITEIALNGDVVHKFIANELVEPVSIAVNNKKEYLVADNGLGCILVYNRSGNLIRKVGKKGKQHGEFGLITCVTVGLKDEIIVGDYRIQTFDKCGNFIQELPTGSETKGQYGGITVDKKGRILATRTEKGKSCVQVYHNIGQLHFVIDSYDDKLKRPSGLATTPDGRVVVVDLGNECIKMYQYE